MGNILRCFKGDDDGGDHYPYYKPTSRPHYQPPHYHGQPAAPPAPLQQQPLGPHGVTPSTVGVAALAHDLLNFESTSMVPDGLSQHVVSSRKAQVKWYQKLLEAYKNTTPPPKTPANAAQLIARALNMIQRADLEVYDKCIGDGDGFTAYVPTTDPRESANVPLEVHELVIARTQARKCRDYQSADALLSSLDEAGYKIISCSDDEVLARKYRIRMRGIDAPELKMPYGKESRTALVKLIGGKSVKIYVYDLDQFGRYVGDIYCNNLFIQEQMLKNGHAWHFKTYDKRPDGRERQELQTEGFGRQGILRNHGIGEETNATQDRDAIPGPGVSCAV
uniref:TNase-like domain-containing protein n=1 Tax=Oryza rufipogon TaxID=4529 RepID=A0A0E0R381_ORYRU